MTVSIRMDFFEVEKPSYFLIGMVFSEKFVFEIQEVAKKLQIFRKKINLFFQFVFSIIP